MSWDILALFGVLSFFAGFIDSIAGGGGLITVPALLLLGLDPAIALGTNKLQGIFASGSATLAFARARLIEWRSALPYAFISFITGGCGALLATSISKELLAIIIPVLLIAVALYFALSPRLSDTNVKARLTPLVFGFIVPPLIGFYDGIMGPGTGSFLMVGFVMLLGYGATKATAHTKLLNFGSNIGALLIFLYNGTYIASLGITMGLCAFVGAQVGSRVAMRFGTRIIRPLLVLICVIMAIKLLYELFYTGA